MTENREKETKTLKTLCEVINDAQLNSIQILRTLINFLYSVGSSIDNIDNISNEELLKLYAAKPTIGVALMAQATYMNDTWFREEEPKEEEEK